MCGNYHANKSWYFRCASSWNRIQEVEKTVILDDGSLENQNYESIQQFGYSVLTSDQVEKLVESELEGFEALREMRDRSNTFRKVVDTNIIFREKEKVLLVDSDVYVRGKVRIPSPAPDFLWISAGVPGYRGHPTLPISHPMVLGFNAGFVFWNPRAVDLNFLNRITKDYLLRTENEFWTEQAAWSALAGRSDHKGAFDGRDVCNISGLNKRSPEEVEKNVTKWIGKSSHVNDTSVIEKKIDGASVLHFAGVGKKWIDDFAVPRGDLDTVRTLRWEAVENANLFERSLLALRMAWSNRR